MIFRLEIQICDQKMMRIQAECENIENEKTKVNRSLRDLRGRLEVLQRTRKDTTERNDSSERENTSVTFEYSANLKVIIIHIISVIMYISRLYPFGVDRDNREPFLSVLKYEFTDKDITYELV